MNTVKEVAANFVAGALTYIVGYGVICFAIDLFKSANGNTDK